MTKMFKKWHIVAISLLLAVICSAFYCLTYYQKPAQTHIATRNIEVSRNALDCQSIFDSFEDSKLEIEDNVTSFEGIKTFNLADFDELDLVSESSVDENLDIKVEYAYTYDSETNVVTLTVTEVSGDAIEIIDTLVGVAFVNESGELDAVFDCDGEYLLLSEIQDLEQIQNCGWFKKALKKIKKVVSNPVGVIGAVLTVAVPAVIGAVAAVVAAPVVATIAVGAVVGAGIAAGTAAASTYIQDGKVDWGAVGVCAGVGAAVGAIASGVAYGVTSAIKGAGSVADDVANSATNSADDIAKGATNSADDIANGVANSADDITKATNTQAELGQKLDYAFGKASGNAHNISRSAENASQLSKIGVYDDVAGRQILTDHFNNTLANNSTTILAENAGRVEISSLLSGPGGFLNVQSVWEGSKLITFWFIG